MFINENQQKEPEAPDHGDIFTGNELVDKNIWDEKQHLDIIKYYSEDSLVPEGLKKRQWSVFGKAFINTFLDETDLPLIDINFELLKINELMGKPSHLLTFDQISEIDKMGLHMFLTARRAIGISQGKMNERILQNTQISQSIGTQTLTENRPRRKFLGII